MNRLSLLLTLVLAGHAQAETVELQRVDISELPRVTVDVRVRTVPEDEGLLPHDLELRLDGEPIRDAQTDAGQSAQAPNPVFLVVDASGDLSGGATHQVKKAAAAMASSLPPGTPVALYSFDQSARRELALGTDREQVLTAITNIRPGRGTSYMDSLTEIAETAVAHDPATVILYVVHASHYPARPPSPGQAYRLPEHSIPVYPVVVQGDTATPLDDSIRAVARRLARGHPGLFRFTFSLPFDAQKQFHTLTVALRGSPQSDRCRFLAVRGPGVSPNKILEQASRRGAWVPGKGALLGVLFAVLVLALLSRARDRIPFRVSAVVILCGLGLGGVFGTLLGLLLFPSL